MIVSIVEAGLVVIGAYLAVGVVAAVALHAVGLRALDPGVVGAGIVFRLLVTPGVVALWPVLLRRWARARRGEGPPVSDGPIRPEGLRRAHGWLAGAVAVVAPIALGSAVALRPPAAPTEPAALRELGQPAPLGTVLAELESPVAGLPVDARIRGEGMRRQLELVVRQDLPSPAVAVYWSRSEAEPVPSASTFLGVTWGPAVRRHDLPAAAVEGGRILLYSLGHAESVGSFALPATP